MKQRAIQFEGRKGLFEYTTQAFRPPKKGEYYLSGAIVAAYRAPNDLSSPYWVVVPNHEPVPGTTRIYRVGS